MKKTVKLTTRGQYAVMAMVELAKGSQQQPIPLSDIAQQGGISLSYLEQLVAGLRRHSLVKSYRGPGGGYILSRPSSQIVITEILIAAEDSTPAKRKEKPERKANNCVHTHELWSHIEELLHLTLHGISLEDLMDGRLKNNPHSSKIFEIFL